MFTSETTEQFIALFLLAIALNCGNISTNFTLAAAG
jgi:hypothetical protein